ncbi:MAG: hypothetical protein ABIK44_06720, partial [candidate division WOR-3 bacterium]
MTRISVLVEAASSTRRSGPERTRLEPRRPDLSGCGRVGNNDRPGPKPVCLLLYKGGGAPAGNGKEFKPVGKVFNYF